VKRSLYALAALALVAAAGPHAPAEAGPRRSSKPAAAKPWHGPAFSASAKKLSAAARSVEGPAGAPAIILFEDASYRFDATGKKVYQLRRVYKILTNQGADSWGSMEATWSPWFQQQPEIRARVLTSTGEFRDLDPKTVVVSEPSTSNSIYDDSRTLRAPLPSLSPGAVVEEQYIWRDTRPMFAAGSTHRFYIGAWVPMLEARFSIDAPATLPLRIKTRLLDETKPRRSKRSGRQRWELRVTDLDARETAESYLPSDVPRYPHVAFSIGKSWRDIGRAYNTLVEKQIAAGDAPGARPALSNPGDRRKVVEETLAFVNEHVRYIGLELGESGIVPYSPTSVWQRRYGDCKDQATLLVALLRRAGVPAHVALLSAGFGPDVDPTLPGLGQFNHAIAVVPGLGEGGKPLWIDPTDPLARAGELPRSDQGRLALVIDGKARRLSRTPVMAAGENFTVETRNVYFPDYGGARIVETTRPNGNMERDYRSWYVDVDPEQLDKKLKGYVESEYLAKELAHREFTPARDVSTKFRLELEALDSTRARTLVDSAYVWMFPFDLTGRLPKMFKTKPGDDDKPRRGDVALEPFRQTNHYRLHLPDGFQIGDLPDNRKVELGAGQLSITYERAGPRRVNVRQTFEINRSRLTAAEFRTTRDALVELGDTDVTPLVFSRTAVALTNEGKIREALAEYQRLSALYPGKGLFPALSAYSLLEAGLGEDARAAAERAVAIEPELAEAHESLAWTRQFDAVGRRFYPGWDRRGTIASYRRAAELDAGNPDHLANLAIALEYSDDGTRYGGDVSAAADTYLRRLEAFPEDHDMDVNLVAALLRSNRTDELRKYTGRLQDDTLRAAWTAIAVAIEKGGEAAWRQIKREQGTPAARRGIVQAAIGQLWMARRYREASELISAHGPGLELGFDAATIASLRPHEQAKRSRYDETVFQLLALSIRGQKVDKKTARRYLAGAMATTDEAPSSVAPTRLRAMFRPLRDGGMSTDGLLDLMSGLLEVQVLEKTRFAVRTRLRHKGSSRNFSEMYFTPDGKIVAISEEPGTFGAAALAAANANRIDEAHQWLDWATHYVKKTSGPAFGRAFADLWTRGQKATPEAVRVAAAVLATETDYAVARKAERLLERCAGAEGDSAPACRRARFALARTRGKWAQAIARLDEMIAHDDLPSQYEPVLPRTRLDLLMAAGHFDQAKALLATQLSERPSDDWSGYAARLAMLRGDIAEARSRMSQPDMDSEPRWINLRAWLALYQPAGQRDEVTDARTRMERLMRRNKTYATLNTFAALQARSGQPGKAYDTLVESLDSVQRSELGPSDWLVMGQVALECGYVDRAREFWLRAVAGGNAREVGASAHIAARWLGELPARRPPGKRRKARRKGGANR